MQKLKDRYPMTAMAYRALVAGVPVAQGLGKVGEKREEAEGNSFWCLPMAENHHDAQILSAKEEAEVYSWRRAERGWWHKAHRSRGRARLGGDRGSRPRKQNRSVQGGEALAFRFTDGFALAELPSSGARRHA